MKIDIIDDDADVRDSLGLLIETLGHDVRVFISGDAFLDSGPLQTDPADLMLLDIRMPGRDGIETLEIIRERAPQARVVMMSGHGDIPLAVKAMRAGALDFVEKPFEASRLMAVIDRIEALPDESLNTAAPALHPVAGPDPLTALTPRERDVALRIADGQPNKIVAHELGISIRTVETHRARVMSKLGIRSLPDLVRIVLSAGR